MTVPAPTLPSEERPRHWITRPTSAIVALVLITVVAYIPAMYGGFIWDDSRYVVDNPFLRSFSGLGKIWFDIGATVQYYPLVFTTFWVEHKLWGVDPTGYHVNNVLLHAFGSVLLLLVLRRLSVPGAWLAAAIFALHPVHVESVAWITERKNVLSGVFYLAAALAYLRFAGIDRADPAAAQAGANAEAKNGGFYWLALLFFVCALLSKTVTSSLPAALLLVLWWKRDRLTWRDVRPLLPMFVVGVLLGLNTAWLERVNVRAEGADWAFSMVDRVLIATRAPWFYLEKLVLPVKLTFIYPKWNLDPASLVQWIPLVMTVVLLVFLWRLRDRFGKGPLVAALFFGGTLFPALGFVNTYPMRYSFVADHFQYLASIGPITLLVAAAATLASTWSARHSVTGAERTSNVLFVSGAAVVFALGFQTWRQGHVHRNLETLYRDTLAKNEACWMAHNNLALVLYDRGERDEAMAHLEEALRLKEDFYEAHYNMGRVLAGRGDLDAALAQFDRVLEIKPDHRWVHGHIADAFSAKGEPYRALEHYHRQVDRTPNRAAARLDLADMLERVGRTDEAARYRGEVAAAGVELPRTYNDLGAKLAEQGKLTEAIEPFRKALELDSDYAAAHQNLADALDALGRHDEALRHFAQSARLQPDSASAQYKYAAALVRLGKIDAAIVGFRKVLELDASDAGTHANLGILLARRNRKDEAREAFEAALAIDPRHARAREELEALDAAPSGGPP